MKSKGILFIGLWIFLFMFSFVSAGIGISWEKESSLVPENSKTCLTYKVYNPWPDDVYARIELSDSLQGIMKSQESSIEFIPAQTSSKDAIPVEFCFKTPRIYERNCLIGNSLICKQECGEEMKVFSGEVEVIEVSEAEFQAGGAGGSATQMSVSAPLKIRVQCIESGYNFSVVYISIILIAGIWLVINLTRKKEVSKKVIKKNKK